jgi:hypothetical protein
LKDLWGLALDLGRYPGDLEVPTIEAIVDEFGSLRKAIRRSERFFDRTLLDEACASRTEDLRLNFALQQFAKRPRYRQLEARLQRDVKAFVPDSASAQAAGLRLFGGWVW